MSLIQNLDLLNFQQNFKVDNERKELYGEVNTPFSLIEDMLSCFPKEFFTNPNIKWLDPAVGCGYYPIVLYKKLFNGLKSKIRSREKRHNHIVKNMIYMCEVNPLHKTSIYNLFGENCNFINEDFLSLKRENFGIEEGFDVILGNPPYNCNGLKKVPTNLHSKKTQDGITIWDNFVKHSIALLKDDGFLSMIIPSIWMKPDKSNNYDFITQYKLHKIKCFSNHATKTMFKGQAQTPTCFFLLSKRETDNVFSLYDPIWKDYKQWELGIQQPIPLIGSSVLRKILPYVEKYGKLNVVKTSLPSKHIHFSLNNENEEHPFVNISTCRLQNRQSYLVTKYSNKPCVFNGVKKLVLAHKMYGFPYYDISGEYGICNRDNYVLTGHSHNEFLILQKFLSSKLALFLYETTRYRMSYLEKFVFEFIPNIHKIENVVSCKLEELTFSFWCSLFELNEEEVKYVENYFKQTYVCFDQLQKYK